MTRRLWAPMADIPPEERRNRILEVKDFRKRTGLAYWSGSIWAQAPVRRVARPLGWKPDFQRRTLTAEEFAAKLTRPQRGLILCLQLAGFGRYEWPGAPDSSLESAWALWRRSYVASSDAGRPDAVITRGALSVRLTEQGVDLLCIVKRPAA